MRRTDRSIDNGPQLAVAAPLHVACEILAYQDYAAWARNLLPVCVLIELTAVSLFAVNLTIIFLRRPIVVTPPLSMTTE